MNYFDCDFEWNISTTWYLPFTLDLGVADDAHIKSNTNGGTLPCKNRKITILCSMLSNKNYCTDFALQPT